MDLGLFAMPAHPPERSLRDGFAWDLKVIRWLDDLGYREAWVGEHHTVPWEPNPAPDLLLAQAFAQTQAIRLGPGGFLLPFHHPAELAGRGAMLDHISQGRLNFGIAASSIPTDQAMFGMSPAETRERTRESLDIILKLWSGEPFVHEGRYWTVRLPEPQHGVFTPHLRPVQRPHPPIGVAGLSPKSDTLRFAGERGFIPMSLNLNAQYLAGHWEAVAEGAASAGRRANRTDWRMVREVLVADTDEEAWRIAVGAESPIRRMIADYSLKVVSAFGALPFLKHDPAVPDSDVTIEYLARESWLIGSPSTVAEKIERLYNQVGGFGVLLVLAFDFADDPEPWRRSLELLASEVAPRIAHLSA